MNFDFIFFLPIQSNADNKHLDKHGNKKSSEQTKKSDRTIKKKSPQKKFSNRADSEESKKIHYVLNPKKIKEKKTEAKEAERREKEKSYQTQSEY